MFLSRTDLVVCFFFFQAEDGIRDLVRSRGLGDVYKRQAQYLGESAADGADAEVHRQRPGGDDRPRRARRRPVSYTHLTLPTSDLV